MFQLYYSEDQGLLDNLANTFKDQHKEVRHVKNPSASELELLLIQKSLDSEIENLIIEHYKGSLDTLSTLILHSGLENVLILLNYPPSGEIVDILDNSDFELKKLTETTKKGYLNKLINERYKSLKIPKEILKEIKEEVPPCAVTINELMENIALLKESNHLNEKTFNSLLKGFKKEFNFFDFLKVYLLEENQKWIKFINSSIVSEDTFRKFSYSFSYQLLELKKYLEIRRNNSNSDFVASAMKVPKYIVSGFKKYFERYGERLLKWLDKLIIDLYIFYFKANYSFSVNLNLLSYFLLKKKILLEGDSINS